MIPTLNQEPSCGKVVAACLPVEHCSLRLDNMADVVSVCMSWSESSPPLRVVPKQWGVLSVFPSSVSPVLGGNPTRLGIRVTIGNEDKAAQEFSPLILPL